MAGEFLYFLHRHFRATVMLGLAAAILAGGLWIVRLILPA